MATRVAISRTNLLSKNQINNNTQIYITSPTMDPELEAIRAKRLAQMQGAGGAPRQAGAALPAGFNAAAPPGGEDQAAKQVQAEEMRRSMLHQILSSDARERLSRIRIVKEEKARAVEDLLLRMAQTGQIRGQVSEKQLIELLGDITEQSAAAAPAISFRRRDDDDDDDEELLKQLM